MKDQTKTNEINFDEIFPMHPQGAPKRMQPFIQAKCLWSRCGWQGLTPADGCCPECEGGIVAE